MAAKEHSPGAALAGLTVVDLSRQAPGPYCSMLLADLGADVVLVEPPGGSTRGERTNIWWELESDPDAHQFAALRRNKRSIVLDLKTDADRATLHKLIDRADVVIEGFRPGVADRLGAGADECLERNLRLVYCSITGYGQRGIHATRSGHDINYLADSGLLALTAGSDGQPVIPQNLVADFAGGGAVAAYAILAALYHRERTGEGQAIDLAMVDGTLSLLTYAASLFFARKADLRQGHFFLSGSLPHYGTYACADGRWAAVGSLEPWFFRRLTELTGRPDLGDAHDEPARYDEVGAHLTGWFGERNSDEVEKLFAGEDACVTVVRSFEEAMAFAEERGMLQHAWGVPQLASAPRLSATPATLRTPPPMPGQHTAEIRAEVDAPPVGDAPADDSNSASASVSDDELDQVVAMYRARGVGAPLGFGSRSALLIVDFQQAYTRTWRAKSLAPVENTGRLLAAARERGVPVFFTYQGYDPVNPDGGVFTQKAPTLLEFKRGSWECEIDPLIAPQDGELVIEKRAPSAFFASGLAERLRDLGVDTVVTCGTSLSGCVRASVVDGMSHDLRMLVVRDCVDDASEPSLKTSLVEIAVKYGDVISLDEALAGIAGGPG